MRLMHLARATLAAAAVVALLSAGGSLPASAAPTPVAVDDAYTTPMNTPLTVAAPGVLANDQNVGTNVVQRRGGGVHGVPGLNTNGSLTYTPDAGFTGTDTIPYCIAASGPGMPCLSNDATITITVTAPPTPVDVDDAYTTPMNTPLSHANILANDQNVGSNGFSRTGGPAHGIPGRNLDGTLQYTPDPGFTGTDTITYCIAASQISDCLSNAATITITVVAPVANDDAFTVVRGGTGIVPAPGLLANDSNVPAGASFSVESQPSHGLVFPLTNGSFSYVPTPYTFTGTDTSPTASRRLPTEPRACPTPPPSP